MRIPRILKPFLKPTADETTPTDLELDADISYVSDIMHHVWPVLAKIIRNKTKRFFRYRWKLILGRVVIFSVLALSLYVAFVKVFKMNIIYVQPAYAQTDTCLHYRHDKSMNLANFLLQIQYIESRYDKDAHRDGSQYIGLYQIGDNERRIAGYGDIPVDVFTRHPELQDLCMVGLLKYNKKCMQKYIVKYSGKIVDGILVTESGILALCQVGCTSAQRFLDTGKVPEFDEHGNPVRLMLKLGGYDLRLEHVRFSVLDGLEYNTKIYKLNN